MRAAHRQRPGAGRRRARAAGRSAGGDRGAQRRGVAEDRRRGDRAGLRLRLRAPRGSAPAHGRGLHHPPRGGGEDLRRPAPRHRDPVRGAAPRHGRGHERQPGAGRGAVRRLGRPARRRGHEAHRDHLPEPRREPGRELPKDDGRDGHGSPGHPDQARRPPPQHAHPLGAAEAEADREGPRDARDLRAARPPAGDPRDQVGARGPLLPAPAPAQVRRDQEARLPAARRARALRRRRRPVPEARAEEGRHRGRDLGPRQALLLDLLEDDQEGAGVQRDLRPHRDAGAGGLGQGLLRRDRDHPFDLEAAAGAVQGLHRDPEAEPLPGAPHDGDRPRGTAARDPDPHPGDARDRRVRDRRPRHLQGGRAPEGRSREARR